MGKCSKKLLSLSSICLILEYHLVYFYFFPLINISQEGSERLQKGKNSLLISEPDQGGPYAWAIQIKKSTHQREKQGWYLFHHQAFFGNTADRLFYTPFISLDGRCLIRLMDKRCQTRVKYCKFILILRIYTTIHPLLFFIKWEPFLISINLNQMHDVFFIRFWFRPPPSSHPGVRTYWTFP